jgi:hypothetical protein
MAKDTHAGFGFGSKGGGGSIKAIASPTGATGAGNLTDWGAHGKPQGVAPAPASGPVDLPETSAIPLRSDPAATSAPSSKAGPDPERANVGAEKV